MLLSAWFKRHLERTIEEDLRRTTITIQSMVQASIETAIHNHLRSAAVHNRELVKAVCERARKGEITEQEA